VRLYNEYGPTECTVWSTVWESPGGSEDPLASVPIGKAIANVDVWVLDGGWRSVPVGVSGEIFLGGRGVARGYLNRADLTAERFLPDGMSGELGARLYRTGDRGRWSEIGELFFLGRADKQVKVRGYRIELGEVESVIRGHRGVGEAVVLLREEGSQGPRLVGYWSRGEGGGSVSEVELREWVRQRLPEPMVPSAWLEVEDWPRTPSGKLDERSLPVPGEVGSWGAGQRVVASRRWWLRCGLTSWVARGSRAGTTTFSISVATLYWRRRWCLVCVRRWRWI
jgi:acyl-coenzyme A synthetase/AMP-(fatty) acid ligase